MKCINVLLTMLATSAFLVACQSHDRDGSTADQECHEYLGNAFIPNCQTWNSTYEGQRQAGLGDGTYLNPIMAGDHPDPSILKDGDDYYMVFSTFESYPALTIWRSTDMVNWQPVGPALEKYIGSIWAPELTKHGDRYYVYIPAKYPGHNSNYVVWADNIAGPWSDPIDLDPNAEYPDRIDPGHIVGEDGKRYLFFSHGDYVQLSDDGLSYVGEMKHTYDGWQYPEQWDVESYAQEGPKMMKRGDYFYMTTAVGGTAGPPTGHMVIAARSKSIHGPWENSPYNPIVRTESASEKWWSRGHATVVEGPTEGDWYMMYHGYENGFHTLGRQALLEPIEWLDDGWYVSSGFDVGEPIPKPKGAKSSNVRHGMPLSDDFSRNKFGVQWSFFRGDISERERLHYGTDEKGPFLRLDPKGDSPSNSSPMTFVAGDQAYQFEVDIELSDGALGGALLFYNDKLYAGVGALQDKFLLHRYGMDQRYAFKPEGNEIRLRVTNDRHILTIHYSADQGETWHKYPTQMEVSGYHHNVAYGFMSLRPALYAAGDGAVIFRNFKYRALP
ncbi:family 43 glycosylhydrolase [Gilvimarinus sp. SDUM040013]|uniref:Family 43 glycosylhydrolase n=1 Tax=Gilvimarinus gilvus TaxID=3058038 RepID=A0ABU4RY06_9GAMM|nr:family 43 glycosylhydrolase [Gilvimarinus sp. SDUM040013]MDO3386248.1 family 43 glycosylhydrolase [Gilvimarinus sp. SDUM040013]MDX6849757.1 family 43 glycosylhydrolase [Gilvimarinus sp. SDUM040013]